jgi:DMSO/TMAO reductase YedYZ molybdopterin-dependent catalytic subunit
LTRTPAYFAVSAGSKERHAQTLLTLTYEGQVLPPKCGFPMKLRMPTKLGYKNPKHIVAITVTNEYPGGYWENQGYNWFGGS